MLSKKSIILSTVLTIGASNALAEKMYAAIVPDEADAHSLISLWERTCDGAIVNAVIVSSKIMQKGCWVRDGDLVKIKIQNGTEKLYQINEFKYMGDSSAAPKIEEAKNVEKSITLTCVADSWAGDVVVERNSDGTLKRVFVSGEQVVASEQASAINFNFNNMNISLSTLTGVFNYETSGLQKYLNNRLFGVQSTKGAGVCRKSSSAKQF